ncbi:MAG TPA: methyltransferase domain-containing protein [Actinomycetes bacterium]|nr:methyltransferase domain-containing protein [Actinomycetes bacterium]
MEAAEPVTRRVVDAVESSRASRRWWDAAADDYQAKHGAFLGESSWIWGPEGLDEAKAGLLGEVAGKRFLEVGCGAGSGSRWLGQRGAEAVGIDLSIRQLQHSRRLDEATGSAVRVVAADAQRLPFADNSFDGAGSAYGALPFVSDAASVMSEIARVLRPASRWVFSVTHPVRWSFPDDPGAGGLTVNRSYFDRRAYVEQDESGSATYVEHHRTLGDWVGLVVGAGFTLVDLVEPEWPDELTHSWGGWSPTRGRLLPGTLILVCTT